MRDQFQEKGEIDKAKAESNTDKTAVRQSQQEWKGRNRNPSSKS